MANQAFQSDAYQESAFQTGPVRVSASPEGAGDLSADLRQTVLRISGSPDGTGDLSANLNFTAVLGGSPSGAGDLSATFEVEVSISASPEGLGTIGAVEFDAAFSDDFSGGPLLTVVHPISASPAGAGRLTAILTGPLTPIQGDAGFTYNPTAGSTKSVRLNLPLHLSPGGIEVGHRKWREVAEPLDLNATREVYVVEGSAGDGRSDEIRATIRFVENPIQILDLLDHLADGEQAEYTTNIGSTSVNTRTMELTEIENVNQLQPEGSRRKAVGAGGNDRKEFEVDVGLRATTDGALDDLI